MVALKIVVDNGPQQTRASLNSRFDALYKELQVHYAEGSEHGELQLINAIGKAAGTDFHGTSGLKNQVTWMEGDLKVLKQLIADDDEQV
ncbi:MAG: hypothetical protein ACI92I_000333 [Acidimicrobiales bacterium]|jgi:hypothetical protein